ncbi:MAG: cupin domain-containing protein [Ferruginibacter sp.]
MYLSKNLKKIILRQFQCCLFVGLFFNVVSAEAQSGKSGQLRMTQQEIINTKASGPSAPGSSNLGAVQEIVIHGDPSKAGLYTVLLKVASHTKIPAHFHPDDRIATVVSGTWYFGYGDKFDKSKLKKLPVGSVYSEGNKQNHFAMTLEEPVIVEITGYGPSGVTYVNPEDDPKNKKK